MKLRDHPSWPPKWGAYRVVEHADMPASNNDFLTTGVLASVDFPDPYAPRRLVVTINVKHKDYREPVAGDVAVGEIGSRRGLYQLLHGLVGKSLPEIAETEFDPNRIEIVYRVEKCSPRSKYYEVWECLSINGHVSKMEVLSVKLERDRAYAFRDLLERNGPFDRSRS